MHQAEDLASSSDLPPDSVGSSRILNADVPQASGHHSANTVLQIAALCAAGVSLLVAGQALALPATWDAEHAHNHQEIFTLASNVSADASASPASRLASLTANAVTVDVDVHLLMYKD